VALAGILLALLGLMVSLFVRPRRTWVRVSTVDGRTVVEVAGLDRAADAGSTRGLGDEVDAIAAALRTAPDEQESRHER
jgi:cytochrome c biogenesis protein